MLRRAEPRQLVIWLATRQRVQWRIELREDGRDDAMTVAPLEGDAHQCVRVGTHCFIHLLRVQPEHDFPPDTPIAYNLQFCTGKEQGWESVHTTLADLCQPGQALPRFVLRSRLDSILHGSCRKPHHAAPDGLVAADHWLASPDNPPETWPRCLMMTGDQVYVDDVAGPMLTAIHELIDELGLYPETLEGAVVDDSESLFASNYNYYHRHELLPDTRVNQTLRSRFFEGARKPIFTTSNADNHLITLAEVIAMYLLVWSPEPWLCLPEGEPDGLSEDERERYRRERRHLMAFIEGLPRVRRLFAHMPTLMIFDDHDITDDWNLTADWEKTAYSHPFSRRIIGNALIGYFLCQGWGNAPDNFGKETLGLLAHWSDEPGGQIQDNLINHLLRLERWQYSLPTEPKLLVLDTRTRRWRSERNLNNPSGLLDWEALSELQNELLNHEAVVIVSPAPVFGVKLIEAIQKLFVWAGRPLLVDAENWMAHKGTANAILNIFRHTRTPANFVLLSGDVHYSFVYGIRLRSQRRGTPHLWQVTSSGIKNAFPARLLDTLDRLNRWLYSPRSPLNWFTRRRRLEISPCKPCSASRGERLLNLPGIGHVRFAPDGKPTLVEQISLDSRVAFRLEPEDQQPAVAPSAVRHTP